MSAVTVAPIRTEGDFDSAVVRIEKLWGSPPGTRQGDELDVLMDLVEAYEKRRHVRVLLHPLQVIAARMEDLRLQANEVAARFGIRPANFSAILAGKRPLTLKTILPLADVLDVSSELLVGPTPKEALAYLKETMSSALVVDGDQRFILSHLDLAWGHSATGNVIRYRDSRSIVTRSESDAKRVLKAIELNGSLIGRKARQPRP